MQTQCEQFRLPDGRNLVRAVFELDDAPGPTIHVCPLGPFIEARDARTFQISDPAKLIAASELPCLIDWEHQSERWGGSTRAAGWITGWSLDRGDGARRPGVYGTVEWTPDGLADIKARAYRYVSPVLLLDGETRDALQIVSVALTNRPALRLDGIDAAAFVSSMALRCSSRTTTVTCRTGAELATLLHRLPADERAALRVPTAVREACRTQGLSDAEIDQAAAYNARAALLLDGRHPSRELRAVFRAFGFDEERAP